jgi:hypothetical protein
MHRPARWAAIITAGAALVCGTVGAATAAPASATHPVKILRYYAFDINNGTADPGFIPDRRPPSALSRRAAWRAGRSL